MTAEATRVKRSLVATPARSALETWARAVDIVAPDSGPARDELESIAGIAAAVIAAEAWRDRPVVVSGVGPQLRIYCLHGEDAILGDDANEDALSWNPVDGDWVMRLPVPEDDLDWVEAALAASAHVVVDNDEGSSAADASKSTVGSSAPASIDPKGFLSG